MLARAGLFATTLIVLFSSFASAQPGRIGSPAPLYLPPPVLSPQGLGSPVSPIVPRPLGYHVAPYGGLGYGPLGDRTGYPGNIYSTYRGSYRNPPPPLLLIPGTPRYTGGTFGVLLPSQPLPPLVLETPENLLLQPGKLPTISELFPGALPVPRMPEPAPPGPVVGVNK